MACFMNLYLNDVYKEMQAEMFDYVYDSIKDVMGGKAHRIMQRPRGCIMKSWETPTMVLEYYPYRSENNIRIALWRKEQNNYG